MNTKGNPKGDGVMTFEDIARALGSTYPAVWMTYKRAIRKLRKGPRRAQFEKLLELSRLKGRCL